MLQKFLETLDLIPMDDPNTSPEEWLGVWAMLAAAIVVEAWLALSL